MNGIDNIAGYTLTVGTADFVITDSIAQYDPIVGNVTNGAAVSYKIQFIDPSMSTDYETGVGTWNATAGTISRTTIKTSSNNGAIVDFGAGPKVVFIVYDSASLTSASSLTSGTIPYARVPVGTTASTVAAGNDGRFGVVDIADMTPAVSVDGSELLPADQGGDPVSITPLQILGTTIATASSIDGTETVTALDGSTVIRATTAQILGDPYRMYKSLALTRARGYSCMDRFGAATAITTTGSLAGNEPFAIYLSGAGTQAVYGASLLFSPSISLSSGSTNAGYVTMVHTDYPYYFIAGASDLDARWNIIIPDLPTSGVQDFTIQIGFIKGFTGAAVQGMYLELTGANANWQKVVKNAAGTTTVSTGIAATTSATTLRVKYNPTAAECQFWIDGVSSAAIDDNTRAVDFFTDLAMTASILKTTGTTTRAMGIFHHLYDNAKVAPTNFL